MIMHIVGNRPQFIKLAPVSKAINESGLEDIIVHTGQHYDENMSDIFFEELDIKKPVKNLEIGSGSHAQMTARAIVGIEEAINEYHPNCIVLYGDTDSTLAGAVATVKMNIPIIHIEAGVRTGDLANPEEANRIVTDHLSNILFCTDKDSFNNLSKEGLNEKAYIVGDTMYDNYLHYKNQDNNDILKLYGVEKQKYILMTWHRQENTQSRERMEQILDLIKKIDYTVLYPMHPRTKARLAEYGLMDKCKDINNLKIVDPVGYVEMVKLMTGAHMILTDSGGVSKESYYAGVKCVQMVDLKLWPDLVNCNWIYRLNFNDDNSTDTALKLLNSNINNEKCPIEGIYGNGDASKKIVEIMVKNNYR